jgi:LemA protein
MHAIASFIGTVFWLVVWVAVILGIIALLSYNKLQGLVQEVKEKSSNVQVALSKKVQLVNQLGDIVKSFQQAEQFTQLKVSADSTAQAMSGAYRESGQMLAAIQATASRFPELKANEQYHRLIDSIQNCEADIEARRNAYNGAVKAYNGKRASIPTVFVAQVIGFPAAPYLEFTADGVEDSTLRRFETPDGEHLSRLLGEAGGQLKKLGAVTVEAGSSVAARAMDSASKGVAIARTRIEEARSASQDRFFFMVPGGVPKGPSRLSDIERQISSGTLGEDVRVAKEGTDLWVSIKDIKAPDSGAASL